MVFEYFAMALLLYYIHTRMYIIIAALAALFAFMRVCSCLFVCLVYLHFLRLFIDTEGYFSFLLPQNSTYAKPHAPRNGWRLRCS